MVTIDMGRKEGAAVPLSQELGPRLIQCGLGRGLTYFRTMRRHHASSHMTTIDMGQKMGVVGCAIFSVGSCVSGPPTGEILTVCGACG